MAKYNNSVKSTNDTDLYKKVLKERGVQKIVQYRTKYFKKIEADKVRFTEYVWRKGDNLFRLSNRFYGDKKFWWTIALFNQKPTDAEFAFGDVVYIPDEPFYGEV